MTILGFIGWLAVGLAIGLLATMSLEAWTAFYCLAIFLAVCLLTMIGLAVYGALIWRRAVHGAEE